MRHIEDEISFYLLQFFDLRYIMEDSSDLFFIVEKSGAAEERLVIQFDLFSRVLFSSFYSSNKLIQLRFTQYFPVKCALFQMLAGNHLQTIISDKDPLFFVKDQNALLK